jgi:hypothetical protein
LTKLRSLLAKGLDRTRTLWPDVRRGFRWVHAGARILKNAAGHLPEQVEQRFDRLIEAWHERRDAAGTLAGAVDHFVKVTRSYRNGLFHWLRVPGLPATNNDLEQFFGTQRHHERRTTGRKVASPSLVVRGAVRVLAATLTRIAPISAQDLAAVDLAKWRETRARLKQRHHARVLRSRFRRNPAAYLAALEQRAVQQLALPP